MTDPEKPKSDSDTGGQEGPAEHREEKHETGTESNPPAPKPSAAGTGGTDSDPDSFDETKVREEAQTVNHIYGLHAEYVDFATSGGRHRRPAVGVIKPETVTADLRVFCRCDAFEKADAVLAKYGAVILVGPEGSGRYLAATALLSQWPKMTLAASIVSFAPSMSIADLARKDTLKKQRAYFVHDMLGDGRASAEVRFEVTRLREVLRKTGARLVITADTTSLCHGDFGELVVAWTPPNAADIFDRHLPDSGVAISPDDLPRAREYAGGLKNPRDVVNFVARLSEGVDAAMHSQSDVDHSQVQAWFDNPERTLEDQLMVAAACFLDDVAERIFERCLSRLDQLVREYDSEERAPSADRLRLEYKPWRARPASEGLVTTVDDGTNGEPRVGFRSRFMRQHALAEIWSSYGYGLLQPLRRWINELILDVSIDVRVQAAMGLALLAERRWNEVKESFLDPWSRDLAINRAGAAATLSMMAASDALAPKALETAIAWSDKQGARRAMTAAIAFGGPLSLRYPDKTFEELWHLSTRGAQIAALARVALSLQLCGAGEDHERALAILRNTRDALEWTTKHRGDLDLRNATAAILAILQSPSLDSDELMIAGLLRARPDAVDLVGSLVSEVLLSAPHFHEGVDLLRQLLAELTNMDDGLSVAVRLGEAVFRRWSAEALKTLKPKLERDLAAGPEAVELSRQIVRSFIYGIEAG